MIQLIADICPAYLTEMQTWMSMFGQFFVGGMLIVFIGWAVGYAVRALFDMVEFMTY